MSEAGNRIELVEALGLTLLGKRVGVLVHYSGGKNILTFDPEYVTTPAVVRQTFTLTQQVDPDYLERPLVNAQRLPPVVSNLLPEGALREWMAKTLKIHPDNEFPFLAWTGGNLPGALEAHPVPMGNIPPWALNARERVEPVQMEVGDATRKFSLAGVQMKFSSIREDGRFNLSAEVGADNWIVKTPSTVHRHVPANEYSAMRLAESIGVDIPPLALVPLNDLDNLPAIQLPDEDLAYVIKRFDRVDNRRVHMEDFAQIFELYAHDKYGRRNYEQIGAVLYQFSADGLADAQQMARRLLANILLANGDAHLKNWSVIYTDGIHPRLSPAYDIVSTLPYIEGETSVALNFDRKKNWYDMDMASFEHWSTRTGVPWPAVKVHLAEAMDIARTAWPNLLEGLPMADAHKAVLRQHWRQLSQDFQIS